MFANQTNLSPDLSLDSKPYTEVTVDALGRAVIEGKNYKGTACTLIGEALRRAVGGPGDRTEPKPEMFDTTAQSENLTRW